MRYDYGLSLMAIICFVLAVFLFMGFADYIQLPTGNGATVLVIAMFSWVLGVVFIGVGYGVRPKKAVSTKPPLPETSAKPKPKQAKSKKPRNKTVRKRRSKKET